MMKYKFSDTVGEPMFKRVVLYARYSTDQQNPASIQTQLDLGRAMIEAKGWQLVDTVLSTLGSAARITKPVQVCKALCLLPSNMHAMYFCA